MNTKIYINIHVDTWLSSSLPLFHLSQVYLTILQWMKSHRCRCEYILHSPLTSSSRSLYSWLLLLVDLWCLVFSFNNSSSKFLVTDFNIRISFTAEPVEVLFISLLNLRNSSSISSFSFNRALFLQKENYVNSRTVVFHWQKTYQNLKNSKNLNFLKIQVL